MPNQSQPTPLVFVEPIMVPAAVTLEFQRVFAELDRQGYTAAFDAHHDARLAPNKAVKLDQLIHADVVAEDADEWYAELAELMPPCETVSMAGLTPAEVISGIALPGFPSPECLKWTQARRPAPWPFPDGSDG